MRVFGDGWPAHLTHMAQPEVCADCAACGEHIVSGDAGVELPHVHGLAGPDRALVSMRYWHRRCFVRSLGLAE